MKNKKRSVTKKNLKILRPRELPDFLDINNKYLQSSCPKS